MTAETINEETMQEELASVRQQIVDTLLEIDDIILQVIPQIQVQYVKSVGYLENDLFKWQIKARRIRRQFMLLQAAANRGEQVDAVEVTSVLDKEFAEWEEQVVYRSAAQLELLEQFSNTRFLSRSESRELKQLHRTLIKRLHPDIHGDLPDEAQRFFMIAQKAYENGDLDMLRMVATATEEYETREAAPKEEELTEAQLEIDLTMAQAQLRLLEEKLEHIKSTYQYNLVELLDNPAKLADRRAELKAMIGQQKEVYTTYEQKIAQLGGVVL